MLSFDGGSALASRNYLVLGSLSGTEPHTVWPGVMQIPLVLDTYFAITLFNPSTPLMSNNVGMLDAQGKTSVSFQLPGGVLPGLQGLSAHHALITPFTVPAMASNPVRVEFVP